jgi:AAA domain-containing protein
VTRVDPAYTPEAMLTAAILNQPEQYENVRWVEPSMFSDAHNRDVWVAVRWVLDHEAKVADSDDMLTRVRVLLIEHGRSDALNRLIRLVGDYPAIGLMAPSYARAVLENRQHTDLADAIVKMGQIVHSDRDLDEKVSLLETTYMAAMEAAHVEPGWKPISGLSTVSEFMAKSDTAHEWVVPGMLERQERFMLVAPEKAGKSVLTRQVCLLLAAGRHPFNAQYEVPPMRTMLVDLENPGPVARRDFRRQVDAMEGLWTDDNENAYLWHKPGGMHLGNGNERAELRLAIERYDIDLLAISPVYKCYDGLDQSWEQQAHGVQKPLDRLREDFGCALWLEHHSPWKGAADRTREFRPLGSSRWTRWLDYQASLFGEGHPPYNRLVWQSIRRDERKLNPRALVRGGLGQPSWVPEWDDDMEGVGFDLAMHEAMY